MLAVTLDGPAPALGEWSFPSPECEQMDIDIIERYKVGVTEDTIQFPATSGRLFVVDRFCTKATRYTYIGLRQRRHVSGRGIGASGAGFWLKDTMIGGKQAVELAATIFSEIWSNYDQRFYPAKIELARIKTSEFPILASLFDYRYGPESPLRLKGGLGFEGVDSHCVIDTSGESGSERLEKALTIVQETELLTDFRRVFVSDDPDVLHAVKYSRRYITLAELEFENGRSATVGTQGSQGAAPRIVQVPAMTSGDAIPRAKIAEIVREEVREILSRSKGPFLPTTAPGGFRASVLKFSLPLGLLQYIVAPGLVGGIAALALLHFSSAPVPSQTNAAARSQTEQASDTTSVQSPGTAVAPQAETSSGGRETSQGASIPINQCDVATLRQAIDDLVTSMGTLKVQQKQVVDAIRTNLDRLKRSAAVAPEGSCKSVSPTGP